MDVDEPTDEEVARQVLARQRAAFGSNASLRDMEVRGVFSRGMLARWVAGDFSMKPAKKRVILGWLGTQPVRESPSYADGMRAAVDRVEKTLEELRALIAAQSGARELAQRGRRAQDRLPREAQEPPA
jgi:hypothetical protein